MLVYFTLKKVEQFHFHPSEIRVSCLKKWPGEILKKIAIFCITSVSWTRICRGLAVVLFLFLPNEFKYLNLLFDYCFGSHSGSFFGLPSPSTFGEIMNIHFRSSQIILLLTTKTHVLCSRPIKTFPE